MLVFVPPEFHLSSEDEKAIYDQHNNQVDDPGYRRFLSRIYEPVCERITSEAEGLDFGCGPGPALAEMFSEAGYRMKVYDLYYANDPTTLERQYDFITATEVIEHLASPGEVIDLLLSLLKPGGTLGLMTKLVKNREAFANWHYIRDPTHICFFSKSTFDWLSSRYAVKTEVLGQDTILISSR
ncbi:class I SAM-dependent methyltransferase [Spongorhabdus nitratireducens]